MQNQAQQAMQEEFLEVLEKYLGVEHIKISLADKWIETGPENGRAKSLKAYMENVEPYRGIVVVLQLLTISVWLLAELL